MNPEVPTGDLSSENMYKDPDSSPIEISGGKKPQKH